MKKQGFGIALAVVVVLAIAFWWGGNAPGLQGLAGQLPSATPASVATSTPTSTPTIAPTPSVAPSPTPTTPSSVAPSPTPTTPSSVAPSPTPTTTPSVAPSPAPATPTPTALTCTVRISCATIWDNLDWLPEEKVSLVPEDGVILGETTLEFKAGESVFDVLRRATKGEKIHLEFVETPGLGSKYIEGIANLYEFDCGERSGWLYKVNDVFPSVGSSAYPLADGDVVQWLYTCNGGDDVGDSRR